MPINSHNMNYDISHAMCCSYEVSFQEFNNRKNVINSMRVKHDLYKDSVYACKNNLSELHRKKL